MVYSPSSNIDGVGSSGCAGIVDYNSCAESNSFSIPNLFNYE